MRLCLILLFHFLYFTSVSSAEEIALCPSQKPLKITPQLHSGNYFKYSDCIVSSTDKRISLLTREKDLAKSFFVSDIYLFVDGDFLPLAYGIREYDRSNSEVDFLHIINVILITAVILPLIFGWCAWRMLAG